MSRPFLLLPALLPLLLYARTATFDFVRADDVDLIVGNQAFLADARNAPRAFLRSYFDVEGDLVEQKTYYRPAAIVSFMLDAARAGADPGAYHTTNIVLHAGVTCLLLSLALAWGATPPAALMAALVFAAHPVNVQAVAWIAGRNDLLLAFFGLLSLAAWHALDDASAAPRTVDLRRGRLRPVDGRSAGAARRGAAHTLAFALALFSKETGLFFPLLALLHQRLVRRRRLSRVQRIALAADALVVIGWAVMRSRALAGTPSELTAGSVRTALLNSPQLLVQAGKMLLPVRLNVAPGVDAFGMALGTVAVAAGAWFARSRWSRGQSVLALAWAAAFLLPTLLVPGLPAYEHRIYLPLIGFLVVGAQGRFGPGARGFTFSVAAAVTALVAVLGAATYERQSVFRNAVAYWSDAVRDERFGPLAHVNLGQLHEADGRLAEARGEYLRALERNPDTPKAHNNLGVVLMKLDRPDEALAHFREEARRHPWNADAWFNLGLFEELRGNDADARRYYERAIEANSALTPAYEKLGRRPPSRR